LNPPLLWRTVLLRQWRYRTKALFMGLGITIGVVATVLLQTLGGSIKATFAAMIERVYPANSIVLVAGSGPMGGGAGRNNLRLSEVETVVNTLGITEWDPVVLAGPRDVKRGGNSVRVSVSGYSEHEEAVRRRSVQTGEPFSVEDVRNRANVALIGATTAKLLFPGESPLGAQLFIDNVPFEVKGILESIGVDPHGNDQDNAIHVPYTTLMDNMLRVNYVSGATLLVADPNQAEAVSKEVTRIVRERHQIAEGQKDDFSVITAALMHQMFTRSFRTVSVFVPLIGGTAFLISAMVILSIMQITIKGRTPEIGLRKAVGARSRDLQLQIVLEVLIIAAVASLAGLLLAQLGINAMAPVLAAKFGVKRVSTPAAVLIIAVGAAIATGLLGGILPARRAARLSPVQALR
jgi:putative ABC transport system permease protein